MAYLLPHPPPLLHPGVFHRHLGIDGEGAAIPASKSGSLLFNQLIVNIKAVTGRAGKGTDTAAYALSGYALPEFLVIKGGKQFILDAFGIYLPGYLLVGCLFYLLSFGFISFGRLSNWLALFISSFPASEMGSTRNWSPISVSIRSTSFDSAGLIPREVQKQLS